MHPLYVLKHEHRVIEKVLRALDGVCARLDMGLTVPTGALLNLVDFITEFADRYHHGKEENYLFPALHKQGIASRDSALQVIGREHEIERNLTDQMREAALEYAESDPDSRSLFAGAARAYITHLTGHIQKEDAILFRVADEMLDETDREDLMAGFERARNEFGPEVSDRYEKLATDLEQTWAE
jgi:hemerythrin-like domain-containing protein